MNSRDVAYVGIRLLAVFLALKLVFSLASAGGFYWIFFVEGGSVSGAGDSRIMAWTGLLGSVLYVVVAVALWFSASPLSRYVAPGGGPSDAASSVRVDEWMSIAFAAVGLYVLVFALSEVVGELRADLVMKDAFGEQGYVDPEKTARYWQLATEMVLGLILLLGSSGLSGLLRRLQTFGLAQKQSPGD